MPTAKALVSCPALLSVMSGPMIGLRPICSAPLPGNSPDRIVKWPVGICGPTDANADHIAADMNYDGQKSQDPDPEPELFVAR